MNKSFIERIFPHSPNSALPRYEYDSSSPARSSTSSANRISLRDRSNSPASPLRSSPRSAIKAAPLSTAIHHDDPFLPIERAAKALERTLQSMIDAQSDALESALPQDQYDDLSSVGSPTPTPSLSATARGEGPRTMPIRQPKPQKLTLRGARKGLGKTMSELVALKKEELHVIQAETRSRDGALRKAAAHKDKRRSLETAMQEAASDGSASSPAALRAEAASVEREIQELEVRLFELRSRHRHLLNRAEEHENVIESKLSSFKHSMAAAEREVQQFLRNPPVRCSLNTYDDSKSTRGGMYALTADRRTLDMAEEQWSTEQSLLAQRKTNVEREQAALQDGADLWRDAISRISAFEKSLRSKIDGGLDGGTDLSNAPIVRDLDTLTESLENDYATAEANDWKLLMVALGAELAALSRARELLVGPSPQTDEPQKPTETAVNGTTSGSQAASNAEYSSGDNNPPDGFFNGGGGSELPHSRRRNSTSSNESLKATLERFGDSIQQREVRPGDPTKGKTPMRTGNPSRISMMDGDDDSEEDDGPSADLLLSRG
ncbi:uncharacterized protein AB675_818 [Cyphellophora attinorum]|uniref:Autophagy-related protein 28 n=1 Tax=Cyphellophora attinorum TaxID=1664694 RepID=A0A0N1I1D1_9EURO|nr:uncharacterized protein AB675_818 [Phialophora attinorum]KPI45632.1 hypothetical protein AB675_818 [Phialophora attinorum]